MVRRGWPWPLQQTKAMVSVIGNICLFLFMASSSISRLTHSSY